MSDNMTDVKTRTEQLGEAVTQNPRAAIPNRDLGKLHFDEGDKDKAIAYTLRSMERGLRIPEVVIPGLRLLLRERLFKIVILIGNSALDEGMTYSEIHRLISKAHVALNQKSEGRRHAEEADKLRDEGRSAFKTPGENE